MPTARSNGLDIAYDTFGDPGGRPLLLIQGLASQMIRWPEAFCRTLAQNGHYVIRFDNRDVGRSTRLAHLRPPNFTKLYESVSVGEEPDVPYRLTDMAADAVGLLDALRIEATHVVGLSMGGMIAQLMAAEHPERVLTLVSIMSSSGRPGLPRPRDDVWAHMTMPPPEERDAAVEHMIQTDRLLTADGFPPEEERFRETAVRAFERGYDPTGGARQLAAIVASGSRVEALASIRVPTLVIHGNRDPLMPIEAGRDTAACIPGARFVEIDRMGHYLSKPAWPALIDAITAHTSGNV